MRRLLLTILIITLSACQQMGPTQVGVRFRKLPAGVGVLSFGGTASEIVAPGQLAVLMPWDQIYVFDTSVRDISWPGVQVGGDRDRKEGFVHTRALDGNEVALAVTVRYRILPDPAMLHELVQKVATNDQEVRSLVISIARSDIRTYMNQLKTSEFLAEEARFGAIDKVRNSIAKRLSPYGIEIMAVILDDFRFERLLRDGTVDASYQERITQTQKLREDTFRETLRQETVKAKKQEEFNTVKAAVNRLIAEANGYKEQAKLRGNGYFEYKSNEAKSILASGRAEVEGLQRQIEALSGPGAAAILKLEIAKQLLKSNPRFIVLNAGQSGDQIGVQKMDTNELLRQLGVIESMKDENKIPAVSQPPKESPQDRDRTIQ